eukprot:383601_1
MTTASKQLHPKKIWEVRVRCEDGRVSELHEACTLKLEELAEVIRKVFFLEKPDRMIWKLVSDSPSKNSKFGTYVDLDEKSSSTLEQTGFRDRSLVFILNSGKLQSEKALAAVISARKLFASDGSVHRRLARRSGSLTSAPGRAVSLFYRLLRRIADNPTTTKFRSLKMERVKPIFGQVPGLLQLAASVGFVMQNDQLTLGPDAPLAPARAVLQVMEAGLGELKERYDEQEKSDTPAPDSDSVEESKSGPPSDDSEIEKFKNTSETQSTFQAEESVLRNRNSAARTSSQPEDDISLESKVPVTYGQSIVKVLDRILPLIFLVMVVLLIGRYLYTMIVG